MPASSSPSNRCVSTLELTPGRLALISPKRRGPNISSRMISSDQRSPTNSSASAVPHASSYQRFSVGFAILDIFSDFMIAFNNYEAHRLQVPSRTWRERRDGQDDLREPARRR